jgi:RND family efflux transporter MFP subunit
MVNMKKFFESTKENFSKVSEYLDLNEKGEELKSAIKSGEIKKLPIFRYFVAFIVLSALLMIIVVVSILMKPKPYVAPPPKIVAEKPKLGTLRKTISLTGYVTAKDMIAVVPFVNGTILEYPIVEGHVVEEGELLAVIDPAPFEKQKLQAQAAYSGYQSSFLRVEALYHAGAATRQDYDTIKAQRDAARAQLDLAILQLGYTNVIAPVRGTVLSAPTAKGAIGNTQQPVAVLADMSRLVVRLNVPEKYFDIFHKNKDHIVAELYRPGTEGYSEDIRVPARISSLAPYIDAQSKNFQVEFVLEGDTTLLRPGMFIRMNVFYEIFEDVHLLDLSVRKVDGSLYAYDKESGTVKWLDFSHADVDNESILIPAAYKDLYFVTDGQGVIFDGQKVSAELR